MPSSLKPPSSRNTPESQTPATPSENRRARRRREKERRDAEAGPSNSNTKEEVETSVDRKTDAESYSSEKQKNLFQETDFIPFTFSDDDEPKEPKTPVREWDKGKGRAYERDSSARKRKVEEYDPNDGYANKQQRIAAASRKAPWVANVDWDSCTNVAEMLHRDVEAFVKYISPTPEEDEVRSLVVTLISRAVTRAFPDAQVLPFGSYETKLYLPIGDIDLVIHSPSMAYSNKESVLHALANTVKRAGITDRVKIIAKAKVPIVKFVTTHGHFSVDISVNQGNGVTAGKMIKHYLAELPALRSLILVIKSFLSQRSMNEVYTGGLGSYSIVCLAISFLQMHPKIRRGEIDPSRNLGVLVMEFFELYGCYFNYHEVGISLLDGGTYFNKAERGWLDYGQPKLLSIEDPGDPTNDISRGSYGIVKVRTTLAGAHGIMTAAAYMQAGIMSSKRNGRHTRLRDNYDFEEMSILASVMGVTQETINHRRLVQEVYDRRILHRMVGVTPQARSSAPAGPKAMNGKTRASRDDKMKKVWEEADVDLQGSDDDGVKEAGVDEEESRYQIDDRRQSSKKRQKRERPKDVPLVFTSDDEDGEDVNEDEGYDESHEYSHYDVLDGAGGSAADTRYGVAEGTKRKRDFWLSKGFTGGMASDSE